jgi:hypothetical protein
MMTIKLGTLEFFAAMTADACRWTVKGSGHARQGRTTLETIACYDMLGTSPDLRFKDFSAAVKVASFALLPTFTVAAVKSA